MLKAYLSLSLIILISQSCIREIPSFRHEKGEVLIAPDKEFKILFNENHAKGESWSLVYEFDYAKLEYIKSNYHGPKEGLTEFIFKSKNIGEAIVKFNLVEYAVVKKQATVKVKIQ